MWLSLYHKGGDANDRISFITNNKNVIRIYDCINYYCLCLSNLHNNITKKIKKDTFPAFTGMECVFYSGQPQIVVSSIYFYYKI